MSGGPANNPWKAGIWLNEPDHVVTADAALNVVSAKGSDFWRETFYGFTRDSGHFLGMVAPGQFTAQVRVQAQYQQTYDQAGIMVRVDERHWVKAGIELSDGRPMLSSVLTGGRSGSDWATYPYEGNPADFWVRATVTQGVIRLQVSGDGRTWPLMRLASFPTAPSYAVGPMCCSPEREGLSVRFSEWKLTPPLGKPLHDLS